MYGLYGLINTSVLGIYNMIGVWISRKGEGHPNKLLCKFIANANL